MSDDDLYFGREQTLAKHLILRNYLEQFAIVVGSRWDTITYVDCFSGPWNVQSDDFKDSSFAIALEQLRKAREVHRSQGRSLRLRCLFLEKSRSAYAKLKEYTDGIGDVEILAKNAKLEDAISEIEQFVKEGGRKSFPFIFVDPTGWTGFAMETISPLLRLRPGEVLVNFMTEHIRRFIDSPQKPTQDSLKRLFGSESFKDKLKGLEKLDREDALIEAYCDSLRKLGGFPYVSSTIVPHPERDRTHFHLIYATRDPRGIQVFKAAERKSLPLVEEVRAEVQEREEVRKVGHKQLGITFGSEIEEAHSGYLASLRERYSNHAKAAVERMLEARQTILYDDVWTLAMGYPLIWEADLKGWINNWSRDGQLKIHGMEPRQRVPRVGQRIRLMWRVKR